MNLTHHLYLKLHGAHTFPSQSKLRRVITEEIQKEGNIKATNPTTAVHFLIYGGSSEQEIENVINDMWQSLDSIPCYKSTARKNKNLSVAKLNQTWGDVIQLHQVAIEYTLTRAIELNIEPVPVWNLSCTFLVGLCSVCIYFAYLHL
jgi:hypothetical protein